MGVSFSWELKSSRRNLFRNGTSSDIDILDNTFPDREITSNDIRMLRAMHNASRSKASLWNDIADKIEALQGDDYEKLITLKIDTEF